MNECGWWAFVDKLQHLSFCVVFSPKRRMVKECVKCDDGQSEKRNGVCVFLYFFLLCVIVNVSSYLSTTTHCCECNICFFNRFHNFFIFHYCQSVCIMSTVVHFGVRFSDGDNKSCRWHFFAIHVFKGWAISIDMW